MNPTSLVAYLALFASVGFVFLFASLLIGRFLRPRVASAEKGATYECGEPSVGSSFVQFDLRFYVVALVFLIFDVEVAFFFPWATVYGTATQLANSRVAHVETVDSTAASLKLAAATNQAYLDLGVTSPRLPAPQADSEENSRRIIATGRQLGAAAMADIGVFFAILLVGFAYVWVRGDLDWVRAVPGQSAAGGNR